MGQQAREETALDEISEAQCEYAIEELQDFIALRQLSLIRHQMLPFCPGN
ncbi:MAG: hypothetical protein ACYTXI_38400 [Nostoc sp.]